MTKGELLDKLEEFEFRVNELVGLLEDIHDDCYDVYCDIMDFIKECEDDDNEW